MPSREKRRLKDMNKASSILSEVVVEETGAKKEASESPRSLPANSLYISVFSRIIKLDEVKRLLPFESFPVDESRTVEPL
jgi:hypothetical protein